MRVGICKSWAPADVGLGGSTGYRKVVVMSLRGPPSDKDFHEFVNDGCDYSLVVAPRLRRRRAPTSAPPSTPRCGGVELPSVLATALGWGRWDDLTDIQCCHGDVGSIR